MKQPPFYEKGIRANKLVAGNVQRTKGHMVTLMLIGPTQEQTYIRVMIQHSSSRQDQSVEVQDHKQLWLCLLSKQCIFFFDPSYKKICV